jgi:hypothetical protein
MHMQAQSIAGHPASQQGFISRAFSLVSGSSKRVAGHAFLFGVVAGMFVVGCGQSKPASGTTTTNEIPVGAAIDANSYYAVLLTNGAVYFGKLEGFGSPWPVMHDVFYVQAGPVDPNTKQPTGMVLVHRGHELHQPDRMILNEKSIVFVEPVGPNSRVAQLIKEAK